MVTALPLVILATAARASRPTLGSELLFAGARGGGRAALARETASQEELYDCPKANQADDSPWEYSIKGRDQPRAYHMQVGDVYDLTCDGEVIQGKVHAHVNHDPDSPVDSELLFLVGKAAREALTDRSCTIVRVVMRDDEMHCIAQLPIPELARFPLSSRSPRWHFHYLLYMLPWVGSWFQDFFASLDETEPIIADILDVIVIIMMVNIVLLFFIRSRWSATSEPDDPATLKPPEGLLMPSVDEATQKILTTLGQFGAELVTLICVTTALPITRSAGPENLYLLLLPLIVGPAAVWRACHAWHRVCSFQLCLCSGRLLLFDSTFGWSGNWVAANMIVASVLLARLLMAHWWLHGDLGMLHITGIAFVIAKTVYTVWQTFTKIVAAETDLTQALMNLKLLVKSHAGEEKSPPVLKMLTDVYEDEFLATSRSSAKGKLEDDEMQSKEVDTWFSPLDMFRISKVIDRCYNDTAEEEKKEDVEPPAGAKGRLHVLFPDIMLLVVALLGITSAVLGVRHVAYFPEVKMSMTSAAHMVPQFTPEVRDYDLFLDSDQPELDLFAQCDPERVRQLEVQWPGQPKLLDNGTCSSLTRAATNNLFPAIVNTAVDSGLWKVNYRFWVRPIRVIAKTLAFRGKVGAASFSRCVHWGEIPGTSISLPENVSDLSIELATDIYEIGLPLGLRNESSLPGDQKSFITVFLKERSAEQCSKYCQDHPRCVIHLAVKAGCYVVVGPPGCWGHHKNIRRVGDIKDKDVQNFMKDRSLQGQVCVPSRRYGEHCKDMDVLLRDGSLIINSSEKMLDYANRVASGMIRTTTTATKNVSLYTASTDVRFRKGTPEVLAMPAVLRLPGGQPMTLKVVMSDEPRITVELREYKLTYTTEGATSANAIDVYKKKKHNVYLDLVPLLDDPAFLARWLDNVTNTQLTASTDVDFTEPCLNKPGLKKFRACGGFRKNGGKAISLELDPYRPWRDDLAVRIAPRPGLQGLQEVFDPIDVPVKIVTVGNEEPLQWLIRSSCYTDADEALYSPKVIVELAARCSTSAAIGKIRKFLTSHADNAEQVAEVLIRVEKNSNASRILSELTESIPAAAMPQLARLNATAATLGAACSNAEVSGFPKILRQVLEESPRPAGLQECLVGRDSDLAALLAQSVLTSCAPCARAVGEAFSEVEFSFSRRKLVIGKQVSALAAGLGAMTKLTKIDLSNNGLGEFQGGMEAVAAALKNMTNVTKLDLAANGLWKSQGAAEAFAGAFGHMTALTELDLYKNDLGKFQGGAQAVAAALRNLTRMTKLDLGQNSLGKHRGGAEALAAAFGKMTALTELNLFANGLFEAEGAVQALAPALGNMTRLTRLVIDSNGLRRDSGEADALALAAALGKLTKLTDLNMNGMGLARSPSSLDAFAAMLGKMTEMTKLDLSGNPMHKIPSAAETLAAAFRNMTKLSKVNLKGNGLEKDRGILYNRGFSRRKGISLRT